MAATGFDDSNAINYIHVHAAIGPPENRPSFWSSPEQIPLHYKLETTGNASASLHCEIVNFVSKAGLPITLESPPGMGSATGGVIALSKLRALINFILSITSHLDKLHKSHSKLQRRANLPVARILFLLNDTTEALTPLVALLPELQVHLRKSFPAIQLEINISGKGQSLSVERGAALTDTMVNKIIKEFKHGGLAVGARRKTLTRWRSVKSFNPTSPSNPGKTLNDFLKPLY